MIRLNKFNHRDALKNANLVTLHNSQVWFIINCTFHKNHFRYHISSDEKDTCIVTNDDCNCYYLAPELASELYLNTIVVPENEIEKSMLMLGCTNEYKAL